MAQQSGATYVLLSVGCICVGGDRRGWVGWGAGGFTASVQTCAHAHPGHGITIFSYCTYVDCLIVGLNKWVEIGNSGMFRPEMLLPMGLPEDVNVIAWGLSLER